jgi:transposase
VTIAATIKVTCDRCGGQIELTASPFDPARLNHLIFSQGWLCDGLGKHTCPECRSLKDNLDECPPDSRPVVEYRLEVIRPLVEMDKSLRTRAVVEDRVEEVRTRLAEEGPLSDSTRTSISAASVYRWVKAYEESGNDWRVLLRRRKRSVAGGVRVDWEVEAMIQEALRQYDPATTSLETIRYELDLRVAERNSRFDSVDWIKSPSLKTLQRRVRRLESAKGAGAGET